MKQRRKPLPYHATEAIDKAFAELSEIDRAIWVLMNEKNITSEERYRLIGNVGLASKNIQKELRSIERER